MKYLPDIFPAKYVVITIISFTVLIGTRREFAHANPYLVKAGEPVVKTRVGTCAVTGGFIHLYTALHNRIFDKYGINTEHVGFAAVSSLSQRWGRTKSS